MRRLFIIGILLLTGMTIHAQQFFNLTAQEVKVDSVLPVFNYAHELGYHYADSSYTVTIDYPEFIPMSQEDIERYQQISGAPLGEFPEIFLPGSVIDIIS